mmetsp:Transcript_35987/g.118481  ORF Transcript_35987/g.118481 Transcript_35987/m.118481 type:complete len:126 (-) Transcript_35987:84-461(-)
MAKGKAKKRMSWRYELQLNSAHGGGGGGGGGGSGGAFDFARLGDAFEGARVLEMRKRGTAEGQRRRLATPRQVLANAVESGPQGALILLFLLLTLADVAFNLSRQFVCVFAELCEPAQLELPPTP